MELVPIVKGMCPRHGVVRNLRERGVLGQEGSRIDANAGGAPIEPEAQDRLVLCPDVGVVPVQVGLLGGEQVQVPLAGRAVRVRRAGPGLAAAELRGPTVGRLVAVRAATRAEPEPLALRGARTGRERLLEPGVAIGDVVGDDVDDRADPHLERFRDERLGLLEAAECGVDRPVVGDVVAAVGQRRHVPGREPHRVHPEIAQVREP